MGWLRRGGIEPALVPRGQSRSAAAHRNNDLDCGGFEQATANWERFWQGSRPVELTPAVERHAGELVNEHSLRGADAVHLASTLAIGDPALIFAVWDRRLQAEASAAGLGVAPRMLDRKATWSSS